MAFNKGDLITAIGLNDVNSTQISYGSGHLDSNGKQPYQMLFYCNRPAGDEIGQAEAQCGWWAGTWVSEYRYENGSWVEKENSGSNGGWGNCNIKLTLKSHGEGIYRVSLVSSNYAHHRNINWLVNQKITNEKGHLIKAIGPMDLTVFQNTENYTIPIYSAYSGEAITSEMLNDRKIYTI